MERERGFNKGGETTIRFYVEKGVLTKELRHDISQRMFHTNLLPDFTGREGGVKKEGDGDFLILCREKQGGLTKEVA